jgi:glucan biosynthesis protein C
VALASPLLSSPREARRVEALPTPAERYAALDALRGGAMLLGVCLHAAITYMPSRMPDLTWGIYEADSSAVFDVVFWWIHAFRLPLFFALAGFFALLVLETKGTAGFLRHRAGRLLVPFLVGSALFVPMGFYYIWACKLAGGSHYEPLLDFIVQPENVAALLGPMHLWFLEDLLLLSLLLAAWRLLPIRRGRSQLVSVPPRPTWLDLVLPLLLALPAAVYLWLDPLPFVAHHNTFVPNVGRLIYYGYSFVAGTWIYRRRHRLREIFAFPGVHLCLSIPATAAMLWLLDRYLADELTGPGLALFGLSVALVAWLSVFGFVGLTLRLCQGKHPVLAYLADSAYWIYLCHMSLVGLLQLDLFFLDWPVGIKYAVVVLVAVSLGFMTYHTMVRYTFIGRCLHGPRTKASVMRCAAA